MTKERPERITYAQEKLISIIEERKLRSWCLNNGLSHSIIYRIAIGEIPVNYNVMAATTHLIAPIEWLFFTDETLPFPPKLLPKWDTSKISEFISKHRDDYKSISLRYGVTDKVAYNLCVSHVSKPTVNFIRACCIDTDPSEFFTESSSKEKNTGKRTPCMGDIVSIMSCLFFVVSSDAFTEQTGNIIYCPIAETAENGVSLKNLNTSGVVRTDILETYSATSTKKIPFLIESADSATTKEVMLSVRKIFE